MLRTWYLCVSCTDSEGTNLPYTYSLRNKKEGRKEDNTFSPPLWLVLSLLMCPFFFLHFFFLLKLGAKPGILSPMPNSIRFCSHGIFFFSLCHLTYHTYLSVTYFTLQDRNTANNVQKWFLK